MLYLTEAYRLAEEKNLGEIACAEACLESGAGIPDAGRNGKGKEISENSFAGISESLCTGSIQSAWQQKKEMKN